METSGATEMRERTIVRDPQVYLVGRQTVDPAAIDRFLADHEATWTTDTEVGGEALAEMAGRVCYMSYGTSSRWGMDRCSSTPCGVFSSPASRAPSRTS